MPSIPSQAASSGVEYSSGLEDGGAPSSEDFGFGYNWLGTSQPVLCSTGVANEVAVIFKPDLVYFFEETSPLTYTPKYNVDAKLEFFDFPECRFKFTDCAGSGCYFDEMGVVDEFFSGGDSSQVTQRNSDGQVQEITRTVTQGGVTYNDRLSFEYSGGRVSRITSTRDYNPTINLRRVEYSYYGASEDFGSEGDLKSVKEQLPVSGGGWTDHETTYFRYYKSGDANGFVHGLKYIVGPEAFERLSAVGNPFTASNATVAQYADFYYEYDGSQRGTKAVLQAGLLTYTYSYTTSAHANGFNNWRLKTVETRPDGSTETVYSNYLSMVLLRDLAQGSNHWIEYHQFNSQGFEILNATPAAVDGYDDTAANLDVDLYASAGLIHRMEYYSSTTATETTAGGVLNQLSARKLQQGSGGTQIIQSETKYFLRATSQGTSYPVAEEKSYRNDNGTGAITTTYGYTWFSGSTQVLQRVTTLPVVPTTQNGSGGAVVRRELFDELGNFVAMQDERGFITTYQYQLATGGMTRQVQDDDAPSGSGWTANGGTRLKLTTDYELDDLGRTTQTLGPAHDVNGTTLRTASWTVYKELEHETYSGQGYATGTAPSYSYTLINPVSIQRRADDGLSSDTISAVRTSTSGRLTASDSFAQSSYVRWSRQIFNKESQQTSSRVYHDIPSSGLGNSTDNYDETTYAYDAMDRQNRMVSPAGTISRSVFDVRNLMVSSWIGTNDTGATNSDPTGGGASGNNMKLIESRQYDGASDGGNGNLTQITRPVDGSSGNDRVTTFAYDFRDRQTIIDGEVDFYQISTYDNLDRETQVDRKNTSSGGNLIARQKTHFDERGRVYRNERYEVNPSTGSVGNVLTDNVWFDAAGNTIKSQPAGSETFSKTLYDGVGRPTAVYAGYYTGSGTESYANVGQITSDNTIFEQSITTYDAASNAIFVANYQRFHDATGGGALVSPSSQPKARVSYIASWHDGVGRAIAAADYGTNNNAGAPSRPASPPSSSDTVLVSSTEYNDAGDAFKTIDPKGMVTLQTFDDAGRGTETIQDQGSGKENLTTQMAYSLGRMATLTAVNADTGNQVTTYHYGVSTATSSEVASNDLLHQVEYPDAEDSSDRVTYRYNRQSQPTRKTEQNGTVHVYEYDKLARLTQDRITTLGTNINNKVRRIARTYEVRGLIEKITSYDNATVGSGSIVNEVQRTYNGFGQLTGEYQDHSGAVTP